MGFESSFVVLRDLSTRITKGTTPPRGKGFVDHGINYIKSEAISPDGSIDASKFAFIDEKTHSSLARSQLQAGNVLFSMAGVYLGKTSVVKAEHLPANTNQAVGIITLDGTRADPYFIHYVLQSPQCRSWVARSGAQSAQPNFNLKEIGDLPIPNLPLHLQRDVGNALKTFDGRIDLLRQTNTTLEAIAHALFKSWFVDFDPVRAKAEGREPEAMDAATAALFPSEFEESELGPIPRGWLLKSFGDSVTILGGGTPKTSIPEYWDGDIPWFSVVDAPATGQVFTLDTTKKITRLGLENCSAKLLPPMTTIISARGTVGKVAMTGSEMVMNQSCYGLRPKVIGGEPFTYFSTLRFVDGLRQIAHGAVFDTITRSSFDQLSACRPPNDIITRFGDMTAPLLDRIKVNGQQATVLAALRDTLLPHLISGKLRLSDVAKPACVVVGA